jgi:hypothetical protein
MYIEDRGFQHSMSSGTTVIIKQALSDKLKNGIFYALVWDKSIYVSKQNEI